MRSRYAAFAMRDEAYLLATWHPSTRPPRLSFMPGEEWVQLRILDSKVESESATVEFIARSRVAGRNQTLHETSRFVRDGGRWHYVDGVLA